MAPQIQNSPISSETTKNKVFFTEHRGKIIGISLIAGIFITIGVIAALTATGHFSAFQNVLDHKVFPFFRTTVFPWVHQAALKTQAVFLGTVGVPVWGIAVAGVVGLAGLGSAGAFGYYLNRRLRLLQAKDFQENNPL